MSEIKSSIPKEAVEAWMEDNNLVVLNHYQMCCKILELEERLNKLTEFSKMNSI